MYIGEKAMERMREEGDDDEEEDEDDDKESISSIWMYPLTIL